MENTAPSTWLDDEDLQRDLRDARRVLRIELHRLQAATQRPAAPPELDCPWPLPIAPAAAAPPPGRGRLSGWGWFVICCGAMLLVCGGVLLGLAEFAARGELWRNGLLAALGGQFLIVLGITSPRQAAEGGNAEVAEIELPARLPWRHKLGDAAAAR